MLEIDAQAIADKITLLTKNLNQSKKARNYAGSVEILDEIDMLLSILQVSVANGAEV